VDRYERRRRLTPDATGKSRNRSDRDAIDYFAASCSLPVLQL
jgi:hypothetical protein